MPFRRRSIEKHNGSMLSILPGVAGQLGKDGFVMLLARWRDRANMKLHRRRVGVFWKFIQSGVGVWEIVFLSLI